MVLLEKLYYIFPSSTVCFEVWSKTISRSKAACCYRGKWVVSTCLTNSSTSFMSISMMISVSNGIIYVFDTSPLKIPKNAEIFGIFPFHDDLYRALFPGLFNNILHVNQLRNFVNVLCDAHIFGYITFWWCLVLFRTVA